MPRPKPPSILAMIYNVCMVRVATMGDMGSLFLKTHFPLDASFEWKEQKQHLASLSINDKEEDLQFRLP